MYRPRGVTATRSPFYITVASPRTSLYNAGLRLSRPAHPRDENFLGLDDVLYRHRVSEPRPRQRVPVLMITGSGIPILAVKIRAPRWWMRTPTDKRVKRSRVRVVCYWHPLGIEEGNGGQDRLLGRLLIKR